MTQPRAERGRFRKMTVQERVARHAAFLESVIVVGPDPLPAPEPFPIIAWIGACLIAATVTLIAGGVA